MIEDPVAVILLVAVIGGEVLLLGLLLWEIRSLQSRG